MIPADFYPTVNTSTNQNIETTAALTQIPVDIPDFTGAYYLGYIKYDTMPDCWRVGKYTKTAESIIFEDVTRAENFDIGYFCTFGAQNDQIYDMVLKYTYDSTNERWRLFEYSESPIADYGPLPNKQNVNCIAAGTITMQFVVVPLENDVPVASALGTLYIHTNDIVNGFTDMALTIQTREGTFPAVTVTVSSDEMDGNMHTKNFNGHDVKIACIGFTTAFFRGITTSSQPSHFIFSKPFIKMHDTNGTPFVVAGSCFGGAYCIDPSTKNIVPTYGTRDSNFGSSCTFGGFAGTLPVSAIDDILVWDAMQPDDANFILHYQFAAQSIYQKVVRRLFSWADIRKICAIQIRWAQINNTYDNGADKYYPLVSDTNEFLLDFANGVADFDKLREWQKIGEVVDGTTADYTEDDKPPYTPPGPEDDEKIGDSIGFNLNVPGGTATGLYTMYALRQAHVSNLGAALWTSFDTPNSNFWQNVRMAAGLYEEAGSFDLSTILDYIASIRIYPFALINLPGYAGAGTGAIRMGTGKIPLDLSAGGAGNVGIMGSYTGIIDAGSVSIPAHYGDFRDLEGVTMSVYLPYIGNVTLNPAEVTGQTLQATYAVDLTSGACVAYLLLSGSWGYYPIGVYSGTIGADIPLTASQGNRMFLRDLKNVLGLGSILGGSLSGVDASDGDALAGAIGSGLASGAAYMAKNVYRQGMGAALTPPTLGGGGANFAGFGAPQTAYVQIRRHLYAYNAQTFPASHMGRRSYGVHTLGTLSGFTVCDAVDVSGIPAPADIQTDIKKALESGVYL